MSIAALIIVFFHFVVPLTALRTRMNVIKSSWSQRHSINMIQSDSNDYSALLLKLESQVKSRPLPSKQVEKKKKENTETEKKTEKKTEVKRSEPEVEPSFDKAPVLQPPVLEAPAVTTTTSIQVDPPAASSAVQSVPEIGFQVPLVLAGLGLVGAVTAFLSNQAKEAERQKLEAAETKRREEEALARAVAEAKRKAEEEEAAKAKAVAEAKRKAEETARKLQELEEIRVSAIKQREQEELGRLEYKTKLAATRDAQLKARTEAQRKAAEESAARAKARPAPVPTATKSQPAPASVATPATTSATATASAAPAVADTKAPVDESAMISKAAALVSKVSITKMREAIDRRLPGALDPKRVLGLQDAVISVVEAYYVSEKKDWDATLAAIERDFASEASASAKWVQVAATTAAGFTDAKLKELIKSYGGQEALHKKKKGVDSENGSRSNIGKESYVSALIESMRRDPVIENDYEKLAKILQSVATDVVTKKGFGK